MIQRPQNPTLFPYTTLFRSHLESAEAAQRIQSLVEDAQAKGAKLPVPLQIDGAFMAPVVIADITPAMRVYGEESFGAGVTMTTSGHVEEAVALGQETPSGVSAAVWRPEVSQG